MRPCRLRSGSRKNAIQSSWSGIFAIRCGSSSKGTPRPRSSSYDASRYVDPEVDRRARVVELGVLGDRQHEPDVAAHEERKRRARLEEELEPELVSVEPDGRREVVRPDRD